MEKSNMAQGFTIIANLYILWNRTIHVEKCHI